MTDPPECCAGVDWASDRHQICLLDGSGRVLGERSVEHSGQGLAELCGWLAVKGRTDPARIGVAIETCHGPIVETLIERGFQVFSINPKQLDRFRDRFSVAGAKDDRLDARVLADSLRTDRHCFRLLAPDEPLVIELREWSRMTEDLQQERNRLANRLRQQLWRYYPQMLALGEDTDAAWRLALWQLAPTPDRARRLRRGTVEALLKRHRIRRLDADTVLERLRQPALTVAPGTAEAACAHVRQLLPRLRLVHRQLAEALTRLDAICSALAETGEDAGPGQAGEQHDVAILRSLPGVGRIVLATLLAEAGDALRRRDYHALRALCGAAPITRRSGKQRIVLMRQACSRRLRIGLYHWARVASQRDPPSRRRYTTLRARGHSHARALRAVGDRLLAVACAMLRHRQSYDPNRGGATLA
jgi:transposase